MPQGFADLSERLTRALAGGDFALYRSVMSLPLRIVPQGGEAYVLTDPGALERDFALYHAAIRAAGVTDIWREVLDVLIDDPGQFRVVVRVHILSRAQRLVDPFQSEMLILHRDGGLRIAEIVSTRDHIDWTLGRSDGFI